SRCAARDMRDPSSAARHRAPALGGVALVLVAMLATGSAPGMQPSAPTPASPAATAAAGAAAAAKAAASPAAAVAAKAAAAPRRRADLLADFARTRAVVEAVQGGPIGRSEEPEYLSARTRLLALIELWTAEFLDAHPAAGDGEILADLATL